MTTTNNTPEYAHLVNRELTESTSLFLEWLEEKTGYKSDPTSVQLARCLVHTFQRSPENQARLRKNAEARAQAEQEKAERRKAREEKSKSAPAKKAPEKKAAPAKKAPAKKAPAAKTATKKAPAQPRRRRKAPAPETAGATN